MLLILILGLLIHELSTPFFCANDFYLSTGHFKKISTSLNYQISVKCSLHSYIFSLPIYSLNLAFGPNVQLKTIHLRIPNVLFSVFLFSSLSLWDTQLYQNFPSYNFLPLASETSHHLQPIPVSGRSSFIHFTDFFSFFQASVTSIVPVSFVSLIHLMDSHQDSKNCLLV